jgi:addiction module HigA family antidote
MGKRIYKVTGRPKMRPVHPGEILREDILPALAVSVTQAARELGISRQTLHAILGERAPVTAEMAVRLGKWAGNGPRLWLAMQDSYDLARAEVKLSDVVAAIPTRRAA